MSNMDRMLGSREVCSRTGLSRVTIWRLERQGAFPGRRQLSPNRVAWLESEIDTWIATRIAPAASGGQPGPAA